MAYVVDGFEELVELAVLHLGVRREALQHALHLEAEERPADLVQHVLREDLVEDALRRLPLQLPERVLEPLELRLPCTPASERLRLVVPHLHARYLQAPVLHVLPLIRLPLLTFRIYNYSLLPITVVLIHHAMAWYHEVPTHFLVELGGLRFEIFGKMHFLGI